MSLSLTKEVLSRYKNPVFIETGTYHGGGVELALECGFETIHSIESYEPFYRDCVDRFRDNQNVFIWLGDSLKVLPEILRTLSRTATFFLDSHVIEQTRELESGIQVPLLQELQIIANHSVKTHTILIDDRNMLEFKSPKGGWISEDWRALTEPEIRKELLTINPFYTINLEDSKTEKDDIIAAFVE